MALALCLTTLLTGIKSHRHEQQQRLSSVISPHLSSLLLLVGRERRHSYFATDAQSILNLRPRRLVPVDRVNVSWSHTGRLVEGSWGRLHLRRISPTPDFAFDLRQYDGQKGIALRLVHNMSQCNATRYAAWYANATDFKLGRWCLWETTGSCSASLTRPRDPMTPAGGQPNGTVPYFNYNAQLAADFSSVLGAVAFFKVPPYLSSMRGYRVCLKRGKKPWVELGGGHVTPVKRRTSVQLSNASTSYAAGSYGFLNFSVTGDVINLHTAMVKLVAYPASTCEAAAVGTGTAGSKFATLSSSATGGALLTHGNSPAVRTGTAATFRAYMTFPTAPNPMADALVAWYRVCFMATQTSDAANWDDIGTIRVTQLGLGYTVDQRPLTGGSITLTVRATRPARYLLDISATAANDRVKVVPVASPCATQWTTASLLPSDVASEDVNLYPYLYTPSTLTNRYQGTPVTSSPNYYAPPMYTAATTSVTSTPT